MIYLKTNLILGVILGAIKFVLKIIFKIIKWLHLYLAILFAAATVVLFFTPLWLYDYVRIICYVSIGLGLVYALVRTVTGGRKKDKEKNKKQGK